MSVSLPWWWEVVDHAIGRYLLIAPLHNGCSGTRSLFLDLNDALARTSSDRFPISVLKSTPMTVIASFIRLSTVQVRHAVFDQHAAVNMQYADDPHRGSTRGTPWRFANRAFWLRRVTAG